MSSAYRNPKTPNSLYPQVIESNPDSTSPFVSNRSSSSLYPSIDSPQKTAPTNPSRPSLYPSIEMRDLAENIFPEVDSQTASAPPDSVQETLITIPGAVVHLVDKQSSVELASGTLSIEQLRQGENVVAVIVHVGDEIQWPLTRDEASVKLDESHYFFSLHVPETGDNGSPAASSENVLSYGVTFASKGQAKLLKEFDKILKSHSSFSLQKVSGKSEAMDRFAAKELAPADMASAGLKKKMMEERSAAYWTTIAPNVEDYSGSVAKAIAMGSGQLIKGILWCGDVTADRLNWGNDVLKKRMEPNAKKTEISPEAMRRMKRVKNVSRMTDKVANGVLSGVLKVSGFFTSTVVNSKVGKQFFGLMPGEIILATLDGFGRICDAAEFAGKNVLSTSSDVTTGLVSHKYGDEAAAITNESLSATGHALGTAWTFFKIRKAFNPKSTVKTSTLWKNAAKAVAAEAKTKTKKGKDRDQERQVTDAV